MKAHIGAYRFHYVTAGGKDSPAILFLHGFLGSGSDWDGITAVLSKDYRCITVDLPGHGETEVTGEEYLYSMEESASAIINLLDELNISQCLVTGYSMGGRLGLYLSMHHPSRVPKAVIESSSPGLKTVEERKNRLAHDENLALQLERDDLESFLEQWYSQPIFATLRVHSDFDTIFRRRLRSRSGELAKSLRNLSVGRQPSLWDHLAVNRVPILALAGEYDKKIVRSYL